MSRGRRAALLLLGAFGAALAACQPLPHPFADDKPPASLLRIRDSAGVTIEPLVGQPERVAKKLGGAVAEALLRAEIPASASTSNLDSYRLYGRLVEAKPKHGKAAVAALWRLYDAKGRTLAERTVRVVAKTREWRAAADKPIASLATLSAAALVPLLEEKAPVAAGLPADRGIKVAVERISGAPGDGKTSLAQAIAAVLRRDDLRVVAIRAKPDLLIAGEIAVTPRKPDKQHIKIVWHVRRADGAEIGTVGQENDIPKGRLDGPWGDVAYSVAIAASEGLMQLVERGARARKS